MLLNKDGSVYQLSAPNPAMRDQKMWIDFITHNMDWRRETSKDDTEIKPVDSDFFMKESFLDALDTAKHEIKVTENKSSEELPSHTPIVRHDPENDPVSSSEAGIEKTFIHCLPAFIRERRDALYGEAYKTVKYGNPTSFEGVIIAQNDFSFDVWTDVDKISIGSVLYPKTGFKRWWRVKEKIVKENGWILKSIPSDYQPSFDF